MRVLIDYRPALRQRSGVGEYTHQLVAALLRRFPRYRPSSIDHQPSAISPQPWLDLTLFSSSWKDRFAPLPELSGATIADRRVPVAILNFLWHRLAWPNAEALAGGTYDVTHSLHPLLLPSAKAAQVITIHDLNFLSHPERTRAEIRRDYPALVHSHAHRANGIVVPSRFTAGEVERRLGVAADRISVCSPGAPDWAPRPLGPAGAGYILFFGTLEPRKNVGALLDAYERLVARAASGVSAGSAALPAERRIPPLVLAGQATAESRPWLDRIARPPLAGSVRHIGYVDPANRRDLYEGALLLVQPSFEEGFGIPVLEAMTLGVPVVAANRGALPEVVGDAGLLVNPEMPDEIASAISRLLDDEAFAGACAAKGVLRSREFRWDLTAGRVFDAYQLAIEHRRRSVGAR